jgi:purine-cytosine permease-like protein
MPPESSAPSASAETRPHTDEFERKPVPEKALKGPRAFWGMYAGEHTAGTEFAIGPLFVAWGVGATDLIFGLLVGNLVAVLCWRFITAPVATGLRQTLYFKLEQICGKNLVTLYNVANGLLFCFLAGAMVTVSATAVGVPFPGMSMPSFSDTMPTGIAWTVTCILIGTTMTIVAIKGYAFVARMSNIAAPWMFLIFVACGVVMLKRLGSTDLMTLLEPAPDTPRQIGFWGVAFFSAFCNAAMHIGMSDMSVLRYARKPSYGWAAAAGMYLGHYIAWICAALLLMFWVRARGASPADGVPPGSMVYDAVGWAGIVCVIIAGWTTANPTIYRAGLAFQGALRILSRTQTTALAGLICTIAGIFPAFAMKLIDFVGIYGTILAPIGAVIAVDYFFARRWNLPQNPAAMLQRSFNWDVLVAWVVPVGIGLWAYRNLDVPAYFLPLPCWLACGVIYALLTRRHAQQSATESAPSNA